MGAGKTGAALEHLRSAMEDRYSMDKALIVAPKLVAQDTWPREMRKWQHAEVLGAPRVIKAEDFSFKRTIDVLDGVGGLEMDWRPVRKAISAYPERVHAVSWDQFWWLAKVLGKSTWRYTHLILDESDFVANNRSARFAAAKEAIANYGVTDVLEMCGGPSANGLPKLWSQIKLLDGGVRMGTTITAFREEWCRPKAKGPGGQVYSWDVKEERKDELRKLLADVMVSVDVDLGVDTYPIDQLVTLPPDARDVYDNLERDLVHDFDIESYVLAPNQAALIGKMRQVCQGAIYDNDHLVRHVHDVKLDKLEEIIESSSGGVLVPYWYRHDWARIQKRFPFARPLTGHGNIDKFSRGEIKLLGLHPASGAHGLDSLQYGGWNVAWFGVDHNYALYSQLNARLARPGQQRTVFVHHIIAEDTLEEDILHVTLAERHNDQEGLLKAVRWRLR